MEIPEPNPRMLVFLVIFFMSYDPLGDEILMEIWREKLAKDQV